MDPEITKAGIYFVGSYKYKREHKGIKGKLRRMFDLESKFEIIKTKTPTEKELLEKLLPAAEKTAWKERILARMEELK